MEPINDGLILVATVVKAGLSIQMLAEANLTRLHLPSQVPCYGYVVLFSVLLKLMGI